MSNLNLPENLQALEMPPILNYNNIAAHPVLVAIFELHAVEKDDLNTVLNAALQCKSPRMRNAMVENHRVLFSTINAVTDDELKVKISSFNHDLDRSYWLSMERQMQVTASLCSRDLRKVSRYTQEYVDEPEYRFTLENVLAFFAEIADIYSPENFAKDFKQIKQHLELKEFVNGMIVVTAHFGEFPTDVGRPDDWIRHFVYALVANLHDNWAEILQQPVTGKDTRWQTWNKCGVEYQTTFSKKCSIRMSKEAAIKFKQLTGWQA